MDHGYGIVIGETAEMGTCNYYQGNWGGIMPSIKLRIKDIKRHPLIIM